MRFLPMRDCCYFSRAAARVKETGTCTCGNVACGALRISVKFSAMGSDSWYSALDLFYSIF